MRNADFYRRQLLEDCLPFWFPRCLDTQDGGYLHCFDGSGRLLDTDKSVWAHGRMAWMLLRLCQDISPEAEWLRWAEQGLTFLRRHAFAENGQMYFTLARNGRPVRRRRYAFSESFACIAFAAHAGTTQSMDSARLALQLWEAFWERNFVAGKMTAKFEPHRQLVGIAPYMIAVVTGRELLEQLCRFHELPGTERIEEKIDWCIREILRLFVHEADECVYELVGINGSPQTDLFDGRTLNPGHAIEAAWFLMREAELRQDPNLLKSALSMFDWMWERGVDRQYGGILYFVSSDDRPISEYWQTMKFWWPHNEAMIASRMAWKLTGDQRYAEIHQTVTNWAFEHFHDPVNGEWWGYLQQDGAPMNTIKGNHWKSFFHLPRALWMCMQMADAEENGSGPRNPMP